ncbi:MAG: hypothetical protein JWO85_2259 [Candidatus Eremiobacteraeota bacterium]|nr:hypothetical protein [Candidatus Eremiobacteraeota bacterium]
MKTRVDAPIDHVAIIVGDLDTAIALYTLDLRDPRSAGSSVG